MNRKEVLNIIEEKKLIIGRVVVSTDGVCDVEKIIGMIAEALSGYLIGDTMHFTDRNTIDREIRSEIGSRGLVIEALSKYWQNNKPILNTWKGIINNIIKKYKLSAVKNDTVSSILNNVKKCYITSDVATVYFLLPPALDVLIVNDKQSCFRENGCNRRHYEFLKSINEIDQESSFNYLLVDTGENVGRLLTIYNQNVATVFNYYSDNYNFDIIANVIAKAFEIYMGWNLCRYKIVSGITAPFYLNNNTMIVCYNSEKIANANIGIDKILTTTLGECSDCESKITINRAFSISRGGVGYVVCSDCDVDYVECYRCGEEVPLDDAHVIEDNYYCESCFENNAFYCDGCGEPTWNDEGYRGLDGYYCEHCFYERFNYCENCGGVYRLNKMEDVYGCYYCISCLKELFIECGDCDTLIDKDDAIWIGDKQLCRECASEYQICVECGSVEVKTEMYYNEDGDYICYDCYKKSKNKEVVNG